MIAAIWLLVAPGYALRHGDGTPPQRYQASHEDWTQALRLSHDLELDLSLSATLLSRPLLERQAALLSSAHAKDEVAQAARLEAALAEAEAQYVVVFSAYSPRETARDFAGDDSAAWTLRLTVDDREQPLETVEALRHPSADVLALYPQLDPWSALGRPLHPQGYGEPARSSSRSPGSMGGVR